MRELSIALLAGTVMVTGARADPAGTWTWDWVHVEPGTTNPITPKVPGIVSLGEAVEFRGSFQFTGMGATVTNHQGVEGPIVGLAHSRFNFEAGTGHGGSFYLPVDRNPASPGSDPLLDPDQVRIISVGQIPLPGQPLVHTASSFPNAVRIRWDPLTYDQRLVSFQASPIMTFQTPTGTNLIILQDPVALSYVSYQLPMSSWGSVQVPIIPSPSGLPLLALAGMISLRRRREQGAKP